MNNQHRNSEEREVQFDAQRRTARSAKKAEKHKNSKFRNSKFGKRWFGLARWKRVTVYVILALLLLLLVVFGAVYTFYNSGFRNSVDENDLGISSAIEDKYGNTDIFNVVLFGLDTRDADSFSGRSDSIIIVSIDKKNNTVKLSSILRDSYVSIEGHKDQKITHAYAFGGAQLAIKTVNQNFNMNITDYVTFNFAKLAEAIDLLGGVDMDVTEQERLELNDIGDDENPSFGYLKQSGHVHLTGEQAVVYARIRKRDSDIARSNRQRRLLETLIEKVRGISPSKYAELGRMAMDLCETSLSFSEAMSFVPMLKSDINIQTLIVPGETDNAIGGIYDGAWVWRYDLQKASETLHLFIYGDVPDDLSSNKNTQKPNAGTTARNQTPESNTKRPSSDSGDRNDVTEPPTTSPSTTVPLTDVQPNTTEPQTTEPAPTGSTDAATEPESTESDQTAAPEIGDADAAA